ncbi:MAG: 3-deoxy-D-manno-octulosonic acid transferase [Nitrospirae bacterium]|nr:3-deoxy-D-manno-octulosonic acid transferase [Nitrospirota bacterium]
MQAFDLLRMTYTLCYVSGLTLLMPVQLMKRPKRLRGRWLRERFGLVPHGPGRGDAGKRPLIWIHAVSVGEAMAARPLMERLRSRADVVVSTVTDTGQKVVRDFMTSGEACIYVPFDIPTAVGKTLSRLRPDMLVIMETELWPNLIRTVSAEGIPVLIANGRISDASFSGYARIRFFVRDMLGMVDSFCMQTERDAERIIALGAPEKRVRVTGNLKFDITPPADLPRWCKDLGRPVIVAGSTHEGEEEMILEAFKSIKGVFKEATLVVAPRHPERFPEVENLLREGGASFARRSEGGGCGKDVVLLDTIGELASVYGCADVCIIGGSLVPKGGHNLFEAASWAKPVVCGPYMENFPLAREFLSGGAAVEAAPGSIGEVLLELLSDAARAGEIGRRARELYFRNSGAVLKTVDEIERLLEKSGGTAL